MKNLLNCHCIGLHSFPLQIDENGLYRRLFYADVNHELWKPCQLAIHPHHVDIKIIVLEGVLFNATYKVDEMGEEYNEYIWNSHILSRKGGFDYLGKEKLRLTEYRDINPAEVMTLESCELHTVQVEKGRKCVWIIEESKASCGYSAINYSTNDLSNWTSEGLYEEISDEEAKKYLGDFKQSYLKK